MMLNEIFKIREDFIVVFSLDNSKQTVISFDEHISTKKRNFKCIFDKRPAFKERIDILKRELEKFCKDDIETLAKMVALKTEGLKIFEIRKIINNAAIVAVEKGDSKLTISHLKSVVDEYLELIDEFLSVEKKETFSHIFA